MNSVSKRTFNLVLGGIMVAMATVLGFIKVYEAPYGGAITVCSMLPILFYSYRCGLKWGLGAGLVHSVLQLLLGMSALRGLSVGTLVGSIFLDYILAFTVLGLGGMFRGKIKNLSLIHIWPPMGSSPKSTACPSSSALTRSSRPSRPMACGRRRSSTAR